MSDASSRRSGERVGPYAPALRGLSAGCTFVAWHVGTHAPSGHDRTHPAATAPLRPDHERSRIEEILQLARSVLGDLDVEAVLERVLVAGAS